MGSPCRRESCRVRERRTARGEWRRGRRQHQSSIQSPTPPVGSTVHSGSKGPRIAPGAPARRSARRRRSHRRLPRRRSSAPARGSRPRRGTCWHPRRRRCRAVTLLMPSLIVTDLAAAWIQLEQPDARCEPPHDAIGVVDGSVRRHDDVEPILRVIQRERVLQLGRDHRLFIVGRDEHADVGFDCGARHRPVGEPANDREQRRVREVHIARASRRSSKRESWQIAHREAFDMRRSRRRC